MSLDRTDTAPAGRGAGVAPSTLRDLPGLPVVRYETIGVIWLQEIC